MLITKAKKPFNNGTRIKNKKGKPGVYLIYKNGELRYVGYSGYNVLKTMYRHFNSWANSKQVRIVFKQADETIKVRIVYTNTPTQAYNLEQALLKKYNTIDNPTLPVDEELTTPEQQAFENFESIKVFTGIIPF